VSHVGRSTQSTVSLLKILQQKCWIKICSVKGYRNTNVNIWLQEGLTSEMK